MKSEQAGPGAGPAPGRCCAHTKHLNRLSKKEPRGPEAKEGPTLASAQALERPGVSPDEKDQSAAQREGLGNDH